MIPVLMMLAVIATATMALADTISMNFNGALGSNVGPGGTNIPGVGNGVQLGPYQLSFGNDGTGIAAGLDDKTLNGFCIDTNDSIINNSNPWTVAPISSFSGLTAAEATNLGYLLSFASQSIVSPPVSGINFSATSGPVTNPLTGHSNTVVGALPGTMANGLSLAIWAIVNGKDPTTFTVTGNVPADSNAVTVANDLLHDVAVVIGGGTAPASVGSLYAIYQTNAQGQVDNQSQAILTLQPLSSTPEPGAFVGLASLACCGLPIGLCALRRRRQA